jgi:signal transduction histidine kinase
MGILSMEVTKNHYEFDKMLREKESLKKHSKLHFVHWLVLMCSLIITFAAWHFTKTQAENKTQELFNSKANQLVELVAERMQKYEDALWSGVAAIHGQDGDTDLEHWKIFADHLKIDEKYPCINGIGIIYYLPNKNALDEYLIERRKERPGYNIKPEHEKSEFWPITYIEPEEFNKAAVGLDMAHENNRYTAAKKARDTGTAQITGPITLVQDSAKTPGFLFYAPFYKSNDLDNAAKRQEHLTGLVYAPFIMKKLMEGTLQKEKRNIGLKISDGDFVLYDEHTLNNEDFDENSMFEVEIPVDMYGRKWVFNIQTKKSFRKATANNQPIMILVGGILIDTLLFTVFVLLSRANRRAVEYGELATEAYQDQLNNIKIMMKKLERTNKEVENFVYIASHDLRSPLINLQGFTTKMVESVEKIKPLVHKTLDKLDDEESKKAKELLEEKIPKAAHFIQEGVTRMDNMTNSILQLSRTGRRELKFETLNADETANRCANNISHQLEENSGTINVDKLPQITGDKVAIEQIFGNLLDNAAKYLSSDKAGEIKIGYEDLGERHKFAISDNGRGIAEDDKDKVFAIFRRAGNVVDDTKGEGMGLNYVKALVERHGGNIWFESELDKGTTFFFTIKKEVS